jgi:hypothetical protein
MTEGKKTLFVRAGSHRLTATGTDGRSLTWEATLEPGKTVSHDFDFDAPVVAETPPAESSEPMRRADPVSPEAPHSRGGGTLTTVGFVGVGIGVAAMGGGLVTGLMAKSKEDSAKGKCDAVTKHCDDPAVATEFDDASSLAKTSTILWIGGGALAAVGVGLVVWGYSSSSESQARNTHQLTLVPVLTGNSGGLFATGRF